MIQNITDRVKYIGVEDTAIELFESQYTVEEGMRYNSYVILDEKVAVMDTVDDVKIDEWLENLTEALAGRTPDYVVVSHMEPDHSAGLQRLIELYPQMKVVGNAKTFPMIAQFFECDLTERSVVVKEGETLELGAGALKFVMAPMVHWPEVMLAYDTLDKVLFSADAFGKFGADATAEDWKCEARRYYYNIVGKYGANVQSLLKKLNGTEVSVIAPLHGPVLTEDIAKYVEIYDGWSKYQWEDKGVMIAYASIHGHTKAVAEKMAEILTEAGAETVKLFDLSIGDQSFMVEDAFQCESLIVAAASYDAGVFPPMEHFLHHLKSKNYNGRKVAIIENGSWAPTAGKVMRAMLEGMKSINIYEPTLTIKSSYKESNREAMVQMAEWMLTE
ncbi:MAG: FprA family A-type flavoprotein [Rikenellaceae bacterium]